MAPDVDLAAYKDVLLVLGTAGVVVPLMNRYKVSPVLGFLIAGAFLSPKGLGALSGIFPPFSWITVSSPERVGKLAELGVVFLLFLIGLELSFERLLTMRRLVFGLGAAQVLISSSVIALLAVSFGITPVSALVIGAALSLSSTAIVIEQLSEQKRMATATGRTSFSILLFQDLAVVPILFLLGVLDPSAGGSITAGIFKALAQAAAALAVIVVVGRFLLQPLFRLVSQTGSHDMFIATTLFVAVGTSFATAAAGLSMALGAFVAGLLLAETEYRRAIEAIVEPIKSLLLGVFFFSVGLSLDPAVLVANPLNIFGMTALLLVLQALIIFGLCRWFGISKPASIETAALLAPGGEFAFIVLTLALSYGLVSAYAHQHAPDLRFADHGAHPAYRRVRTASRQGKRATHRRRSGTFSFAARRWRNQSPRRWLRPRRATHWRHAGRTQSTLHRRRQRGTSGQLRSPPGKARLLRRRASDRVFEALRTRHRQSRHHHNSHPERHRSDCCRDPRGLP